VDWPRGDLMAQMAAGETVALSTTRSTEIKSGWEHVFCANALIQHHTVSLKEVNYLFPIYRPSKGTGNLFGRTANLTDEFISELERILDLEFRSEDRGDLKRTIGAEDVLGYIYAILHSTTYRQRYRQFLKNDFPRVPLVKDAQKFGRLCGLGRKLIDAHLLRKVPEELPDYPIEGSDRVERVEFREHRVYINDAQLFEPVTPEVWKYRIGGYQVAERWLKDRIGRKLSFDDLEHYRQVVGALRLTIKIQDDIGGILQSWPVA
jgi:Type ISP C-terminal specificity domain